MVFQIDVNVNTLRKFYCDGEKWGCDCAIFRKQLNM